MTNLSSAEIEQKFNLLKRESLSPCIYLETRKNDPNNHLSYYFCEARDSIALYQGDEPLDFFQKLEQARKSGYWLAGYFCYEAGYYFEPRLFEIGQGHHTNHPLAWFGVFDRPLIIDEYQVGQTSELKYHPFLITKPEEIAFENLDINITPEDYYKSISEIKSFLKEGDTYQVNYTLKYKFSYKKNPMDLFRILQSKQNVAYSAYINDGQHYYLSLSPELFFKKEGDMMTSRPMKGTIQRGRYNFEDDENSLWLANDPKNRAENTMIVDLVRNDLGKISQMGSVNVVELYQVEKFSTLHQMTSTITSTLQANARVEDLFYALFPFGSITGAPKIRTMEIINKLEKEPRGIYTGAIGYITPDGDAQFNVAIRTLAIDKNGRGEMGIGGGIVADSFASDEFDECLLKGNFLSKNIDPFSLIETMKLKNGQIFLLDLHLERLIDSAFYFDIACPAKQIEEDLKDICSRQKKGPYKIRLLLHQSGVYDIEMNPIKKPQKVQPMRVKISEERLNSENRWLYHKTTNRDLYEQERELALSQGFNEVIFLNEKEEVSEGAISNIFLIQSGQLITPSRKSGLLNGTLRQSLLDACECQEAIVQKQDLLDAEKIFIGNSVIGLVEAKLTIRENLSV